MLTVATVFLAGAVHAQLTPPAVRASSDDGSVTAKATDGNTGTRWSASGDEPRLQVDLGATRTVNYIAIGVLQGQRVFERSSS